MTVERIYVDIQARLNKRSFNDAFRDLNDHSTRAGQDAGQNYGRQFSTGVERSLARATAATDRLREAQDRLNASLRSGDVQRVTADYEHLARVHRDTANGSDRLVSSLGSLAPNLTDLGNGASSAVTSLTGVGNVLGALGRIATPAAIAGVGAALVEVAGVAASAAQSLWLLPGAITAAGAGIGTLVVGFQNFGDAVDNLRDPDKFAESLHKLAPSAQQAALGLQALLPAWDSIARSTQESLFSGVAEDINALAQNYLPSLQSMMNGIASSFSSMFSGVTAQLLTPETQATINSTTSNIVASFQALSGVSAPLTAAIAQISQAGSSFLPSLAQAATDAANAFAQFIDNAARSGDLQRWLSEGLTTLQQLGTAAGYLVQGFASLAPTAERILPDIVKLCQDIRDIMPIIGAAALTLGPQFGLWAAAVTQVKTAVDFLSDGFDRVKDVVKGVHDFIKPVLDAIKNYIDAALGPLDELVAGAANLLNLRIPERTTQGTATAIGTPTVGPGQPQFGGYAGASRERRGAAPITTTPVMPSIAPVPIGGYTMPAPPPTTTGSTGSTTYSSSYSGSSNVDRMLALAQASNGAAYGAASDLANGLADCSGAISDLVEVLNTGTSSPERLFTTVNFASDAEARKLGFLPGYMPGALNIGVNPYPGNSGHMAATLPNGVNFESGGSGKGVRYGNGAAGALDPQFEKRYYRPVDTASLQSGRPGAAPVPVSVREFSGPAASAIGELGAGLDQDLGLSRGLPGLVDNLIRFVGSLATAPLMGPLSQVAQSSGGGSGLIGMLSAPTPAAGAAPTMPTPFSPGPIGSPFGAAMSGSPMGPPPGPPQYAQQQPAGNWSPGGGGGFQGLGGAPMGAIQAGIGAAAAAGAPFGGQAAGAAAQMAMQLINRTIGYAGQAASIGVGGLLETFGLGDSALADPSKSLIGRVLQGFSGARPQMASDAGNTRQPLEKQAADSVQRGQEAAKNAGAGVHIDQFVQAPDRNHQQVLNDLAFQVNAGGSR